MPLRALPGGWVVTTSCDGIGVTSTLLDVAPSRSYFLGLFGAQGIEPKVALSSPSIELVRGFETLGAVAFPQSHDP